jgi:uncharacterized protein YuzE
MKIIVEEYIDAGYIYLNHDAPKKTVAFGDHYVVDLSEEGHVVGVEILDIHAGSFDRSAFVQRFKVEEKLASILEDNILRVKRIAVKK